MTTNNTKDEIQEDDEPFYMTLEYEDGTTIEVEVMGVFEAEGKEYMAVIPDDGTDDVYIYLSGETEDGEIYPIDIEDDEEFEKAVKAFDAIMGAPEQ